MQSTAREHQRDQIIQGAIHVLSEEGLANASTRKIAQASDVNQAMINYYFGSKDELFMAVLETVIADFEGQLKQNVRVDAGLRAMFESGLNVFWQQVEAAVNYQMMQYELFIYSIRQPQSASLARRQYEGYRTVVTEMIRMGCVASNLTCVVPPEEIASFIIASLDGLILQYIADLDAVRARRVLKHILNTAVMLVEGTIEQEDTHGQN